ncbi:MAG: RNase adapter RapZ [Aerococcus sp.]|nr:RNase adapter RapZ [Aerococcus sp.]
MNNQTKLVVITGMSGAGKTVTLQCFEDMGYFCVDNMPPSLLPKFWELIRHSESISRVCLVIDLRSGQFFKALTGAVMQMDNDALIDMQIVYLEASDSALVSRYKETRRNHPLQREGGSILEGIQRERQELAPIRQASNLVLDTTNVSPRELRATLKREFHTSGDSGFSVEVISFGFKYGIPIDADIVMDVRFLPNPYYVESLRMLTGQDQPVYDYVMQHDATETFFETWSNMIQFTLPLYQAEGKSNLTIAIGCTGGQHRSVALAERTAHWIEEHFDYPVHISHRDINKKKETVNRS